MPAHELAIKTFSSRLVFSIEYKRISSAKSHAASKIPSLTKTLKSYFLYLVIRLALPFGRKLILKSVQIWFQFSLTYISYSCCLS
jgi:hypothetical protein